LKTVISNTVMLITTLLCGLDLEARDVAFSGMSLSFPDGWQSHANGGLPHGAGPAHRRAVEEATLEELVLVRDEEVLANAVVGVRERYLEVSETRISTGRREIEEQACAAGLGKTFRVLEVRVVQLQNAPAYRVRAAVDLDGVKVEQLQYLISGRKTHVLTFSAPAESFSRHENEFAAIADSARIESRPVLLQEMPPWFCGSALGLLAGIGIAARRVRRGARRASSGASASV